MKKILWTVALCLALIPAKAQQTPDARKILDETASLFTSKGGVKATFKADNFTEGNVQGSATGTMCIQGNKFQMTTPDMITWYNGETQWSYMKANDEVNVSVPTPEEQQSMNPYTFVNLYKEGYHYQLKETTLRGKSCYEITLTARNKQKSPHTIILARQQRSIAQPWRSALACCSALVYIGQLYSNQNTYADAETAWTDFGDGCIFCL